MSRKQPLTVILASLGLLLLAGPVWREGGKFAEPFSVDGWAKSDSSERYSMLGDLTYRGQLFGLTRAELREKLGPSSAETPLTFRYQVGPAYGDSETFLVVTFDLQGRVTRTEVVGTN